MSDALINGLAGASGGIIVQLITYPLQTANTRQQTERDLKKEKRKLGTVEQMYQVMKHEGWSRLYSRLAPSLVNTAVS